MPAENPAVPARLPHFDTVIRGYNPRQVNERVTRLTYDLRHATQGRNEAVTKVAELTRTLGSVQHELAETKDRLTRLSASPNSAEGMTERVRMIMHLAEEEIADYRAKADEYDRTTRDEADRYSYAVHAKADEHALVTRVGADTYATVTRTAADDHAARVRAEVDAYVVSTKVVADRYVADTRAEAERHMAVNQECIADLNAEADDRIRRAEEVQRRVADQIDAALAVLGDAKTQYGTTSSDRARQDVAV